MTPTTKVRPSSGRASRKGKALPKAPNTPFPETISPMLATLVDAPADGTGWIYEVKWDGYRTVAFCKGKDSELISRNNKSFNEKFYPIYKAVQELKTKAVLDGEVVAIKENGISSFGALQNWRSEADGELLYYVFDILWLEGQDLRGLPLTKRREILRRILPRKGLLRFSENFDRPAHELLDAARKMGLEGIIAKRADSIYQSGQRSRDWLKIKVQQRHEVVIGGYTLNEHSPKLFSSLLVGVYANGKLHYTGKIGTGFDRKTQKSMMESFRPLVTDKVPFDEEPDINAPSRFRPNPPHTKAVWLKPRLVCEVSYTELTSDGVMRHPSFEGMRIDKSAKDVHPEKTKHVEDVAGDAGTAAGKEGKKGKYVKREAGSEKGVKGKRERSARGDMGTEAGMEGEKGKSVKMEARSEKGVKGGGRKGDKIAIKSGGTRERKTLLNPSEDTQVRSVNGHELTFRNLGKIFWPKEGYTKRDLINYYYQVAPFILPYLTNRPQSLNRFPNGIEGKSFYQKDVTSTAPDWVRQFPYHTSQGEDKNYLVVEDEASLLWMANLGAIEMNPWNSRVDDPDNPDWCIIDLDPTDKNSFEQVIETAQITHQVLEELKVPSYPKTSGSTGIHIYIPMGGKYTYEECQLFGKLIAMRVHHRLPGFTSIERMTENRKGKIYVDYLQNRPKATLAAPYAVRPKPGATVSMPLHWEEVKKGLKIAAFTILNSIERIRREGDLFRPVLGKGIDLRKVLKNINGNS